MNTRSPLAGGLIRALLALVATATLSRPEQVRAQVIAPADLHGTWVQTRWMFFNNRVPRGWVAVEQIWTFRADSTASSRTRLNGVELTEDDPDLGPRTPMELTDPDMASGAPQDFIHWSLREDTLLLRQKGDTGRGYEHARYARHGEHLLQAYVNYPDFACADTLRRIDASKPLPPPVAPARSITVAPAALVGTWVGGITGIDTLMVGTDSTWSYHRPQTKEWHQQINEGDRWRLYPGDVLSFEGGDNPLYGAKIILKDRQLNFSPAWDGSGCDQARPEPWVFKKVSP